MSLFTCTFQELVVKHLEEHVITKTPFQVCFKNLQVKKSKNN